MASVTLNNGSQIWAKSAKFDTRLKELEMHIMSGPSFQSTEAIQVLTELGPLATDSVSILQAYTMSLQDTNPYKHEITTLLEKISTPKIENKLPIEKVDVEIKSGDLETEAQVYKKCNFCEKESLIKSDVYINKLCAPGTFYCRFCLRHSYYNRDNNHLLMLSLRSVFGYYFWQFYYGPSSPYMWLSEIKDYIRLHEEVGLRNPLFNYDPETYTWFVDFRRVGDSKKKLPLKEVKRTLVEMLALCNLHVHVKGLSMSDFYQKYALAIDEFYQKRHRPEGRRLLCPTFKGCGAPQWGTLSQNGQLTIPTHEGNKVSLEDTRSFSPEMLRDHLWNKTL